MTTTVVLIGGGHWGTILARNLQQLQLLHTIVEPNAVTAARLRQTFPEAEVIPALAGEFTHAIVATPPSTHLVVASAALELGCHVWVEKPVGLDGKQAEQLFALAQAQQRQIMGGYLLNYLEVVNYEPSLEWGPLRHVMCERIGNGIVRPDVDVVHDLMVHDVGLALMLLTKGHPERFVSTRGQVQRSQDGCVAHGTWHDVVHQWEMHCTASWLSPMKRRVVQMTFANGFMLEYDDVTKEATLFEADLQSVWQPRPLPKDYPRFAVQTPLMAQLEAFVSAKGATRNGPDLIRAVHTLLPAPPASPMFTLDPELARHGPALAQAVSQVVLSGRYILGPEVEALETELAACTGAAHVVTCASGTAALTMALQTLGIGLGDRVAVPSFTFWASVEAIVNRGASPEFIDVNEYGLMDVEQAVQANAKAIMFVSLFGSSVGLRYLQEHAQVPIIEDACQSFGARGSCAPTRPQDIACTSFFPTKPLGGCGDGGALFVQDPELARRLRVLRAHGYDHGRYVTVSHTRRLDAVQAAFLRVRLSYFHELHEGRVNVRDWYAHELDECKDVQLLQNHLGATAAQIVCRTSSPALRTHLVHELSAVRVYYERGCHEAPALGGQYADVNLPMTQALCATVFALPCEPYMDRSAVHRVVAEITHQCHVFAQKKA